ncbi:MAG: hypothetical protein U0X20_21415 [Caldilineaceae bacterium]
MSSQLQWTILDVEEEEWKSVVGAATADKLPSIGEGGIPACHSNWHRPRMLITITAVAVLLVTTTYAIYRRAEQGVAHMRGDIEVAVKAETLHQRMSVIGQDEHAAVETTEFLNDKAMAQVVVTQTLPNGHEVTHREVRFYTQSHQGWSRTEAIEAFWGAPATLDTQHLHFVFGAKDREIVVKVAADAEAYYIALRRILGPPSPGAASPSSDPLTIELVPRIVTMCERPEPAWLRLTSPLLYEPTLDQAQSDILAAHLREALLHQVVDIDTPILQPKTQWAFMALGLRGWLLSTDRLPLASDSDHGSPDLVVPNRSARMDQLLSVPACSLDECSYLRTQTASSASQAQYLNNETLSTWQEAAALLDYVATEYGLDALGSLVQGFARYDEWEPLVPAALGISAQELEAGWLERAAPNETAPNLK